MYDRQYRDTMDDKSVELIDKMFEKIGHNSTINLWKVVVSLLLSCPNLDSLLMRWAVFVLNHFLMGHLVILLLILMFLTKIR